MASITGLLRLMLPLNEEERFKLSYYGMLEKSRIKKLRKLLKQKKLKIMLKNTGMSEQLVKLTGFSAYPVAEPVSDDSKIVSFTKDINETAKKAIEEEAYRKFSEKALETIEKLIALNIVGLNNVKKAVALQLFASYSEPVHILLLGDPGTGKTDIIRSAAELSPVSSFGLGSGTTGVGLTMAIKGSKLIKGLLPSADKGLCCIDELNLMQDKDRASLYNAMEKGFISYDKGSEHHKIDAKVKVLATANPKNDQFAGWTVETLRKQIPFDSALLTRFHLVFLIRKPDLKEFLKISKNIITKSAKKGSWADSLFIKSYIAFTEKSIESIKLNKETEKRILEFISELKKNEKSYITEISPRTVHGIIRLAKASARARLSTEVSDNDIKIVTSIIRDMLSYKP